MKRRQLVSTLALSVGVASWFAPLSSPTLLAGECDSPRMCQCRCSTNNGLLDTLDQYATKMTKPRKHRSSILAAFKIDMSMSNSKCDQIDCDCEPTCGSETNDCAQSKCGVETTPAFEAPAYSHVIGPVEYPRSTARGPASASSSASSATTGPQTIAPNTNALPRVPDAERIPVPKVEDSTIDPFRDDTTTNLPTRLRAQPASRRTMQKALPRATNNVPPRTLNNASQRTMHNAPQRGQKRPVMSFDPHSQAVPVPPQSKRDLERKSLSLAAQISSSRRSTVVHRLLTDESEPSLSQPSAGNVVVEETFVAQSEPTPMMGEVIQASAHQPARLPAVVVEQPMQSPAPVQPLEMPTKSNGFADLNPLRD